MYNLIAVFISLTLNIRCSAVVKRLITFVKKIFIFYIKIKVRSVAHTSQVSHTDQLDFCNWLADCRQAE